MDKFLTRISKEEYSVRTNKALEDARLGIEETKRQTKRKAEAEALMLQARKRRNQQDHRQQLKMMEIQLGKRDPNGTIKRQPQREIVLQDPDIWRVPLMDMPAITRPPTAQVQRPARQKKTQKNTNWFSPSTWPHIQEAALRTNYSATFITKDLQLRNPKQFSTLTKGTVQYWLNRDGKGWSEKTLARIERGVGWEPSKGRLPILDRAGYVELKQDFIEALKGEFISSNALDCSFYWLNYYTN